MKVLVTNDDGRCAPGINNLVNFLENYDSSYEVYVSAPIHDKSCTSRSVTITRDIVSVHKGKRDYAITGTPADSAIFGIEVLFNKRMGIDPDVVISGVNSGLNTGVDITYSGTIGACIEAWSRDIPSIALSANTADVTDSELFWSKMGGVLKKIFDFIIGQNILSKDYILSVNIPADLDNIKGIIAAQQNLAHSGLYHTLLEVEDSDSIFRMHSRDSGNGKCMDDMLMAKEKGYVVLTPLYPNWTYNEALENIKSKCKNYRFND